MKMIEGRTVTEHLNEFNTVTSQLTSVDINFNDEVRALLILSSLPESWDNIIMAVNNSLGSGTLKFDDVVSIILNKKVRRKPIEEASSSESALNLGGRERTVKRGQDRGRSKSMGKSKLAKLRMECWNYGKK